ncbi:3D domain-containing protein [Sporolactobacillus sp. THM19-2]|uniref:3D domain-containing protein n=1 Tax=Sporolactobacillus sp. THM19-2 TaxID=2511171 RepID=UPI001020700E|nr:3D domain-containing protein [Sporolactobacillus sp. THM19-2]RYL87567.1 peptidoglycan-binding protein [Sporolactobacillus sp. THM19-2]
MYTGNALAKSAAVAATVGSSIFMVPQVTSGQVAPEDLYRPERDEIYTIQSLLKAIGHYPPSGRIAFFSGKKVRHLQLLSGMTESGWSDVQTRQAFDAVIGKVRPLRSGSAGQEVLSLQKMLKKLGYYEGKVDGIYGRGTGLGVSVLQKKTGITVDGVTGPETWKSIENLLIRQKKGENVRPDQQVFKELKRGTSKKTGKSSPTGKVEKKEREKVTIIREFYANSTAYTAFCSGCSGTTATGINLRANPNAKVVAVDPAVIPLGTKLYVEGYGHAVAGDTGGAIKGRRIDVFFKDNQTALQWGRRTVKVKILE